MSATFAGLGIPFPLFDAPALDADSFEDEQVCFLCDRLGPAFLLGIGDDLIVQCPHCAAQTAVDADDRRSPCVACGKLVPLQQETDEDLRCCYACLRGGKVAMTKDTEYGMMRAECEQTIREPGSSVSRTAACTRAQTRSSEGSGRGCERRGSLDLVAPEVPRGAATFRETSSPASSSGPSRNRAELRIGTK